jgi:hypothetical protein
MSVFGFFTARREFRSAIETSTTGSPMKRNLLAVLIIFVNCALADAQLISVNWAPKSTTDGLGSGTLGALGVTLTSTDGGVNGGETFSADWPNRLGTKDVTGIASLAGANRSSIDWNSGEVGHATIAFTGGTVTNPLMLFDFTDPAEKFDFGSSSGLSSINLLDSSPPGSVAVTGAVVTLSHAPNNNADDSFAIQLLGTFSTISLATNLNMIEAESVGFTIAVPEPSALSLAAISTCSLFLIHPNRAIPRRHRRTETA